MAGFLDMIARVGIPAARTYRQNVQAQDAARAEAERQAAELAERQRAAQVGERLREVQVYGEVANRAAQQAQERQRAAEAQRRWNADYELRRQSLESLDEYREGSLAEREKARRDRTGPSPRPRQATPMNELQRALRDRIAQLVASGMELADANAQANMELGRMVDPVKAAEAERIRRATAKALGDSLPPGGQGNIDLRRNP